MVLVGLKPEAISVSTVDLVAYSEVIPRVVKRRIQELTVYQSIQPYRLNFHVPKYAHRRSGQNMAGASTCQLSLNRLGLHPDDQLTATVGELDRTLSTQNGDRRC